MSISLPAKIASGVLAGGTVATGSVFLYRGLSKPQTHLIKDLLISKNPEKRLISESNDGSTAEWKAAGKAYREAYKDKSSDPFSLTSTQLKDSSPDPNAPLEFMSGCKSLSMEKIVDDKDGRYQTVSNYCTRATLVSDLINETEGKSLLAKGTDFANNGDGKVVWNLYRGNENSPSTDKGNLGQSSEGTSEKAKEAVPDKFASKCLEKSKVEEYKFDQPTYLDVLKYCTKSG